MLTKITLTQMKYLQDYRQPPKQEEKKQKGLYKTLKANGASHFCKSFLMSLHFAREIFSFEYFSIFF